MLGKNLITAAAGSGGPEPIGYIAYVNTLLSGIPRRLTLLQREDVASMSFATTYTLSTDPNTVNYSSDGNYLIVGFWGATGVALFDTSTAGTLSFVTSYVNAGATNIGGYATKFSPDDNYVLASGSTTLTLLDHTTPGTLTLATTYALASGIGGADFSPDGNYICVVGRDATTVTLLDHTTPGSVSLAATYTIYDSGRGCDFSPDGNYIAVCGKTIFTLLDHTTPGSLSLSATYNVGTALQSFSTAFSPDGNYLALTSSRVVLLNHTTPGSLSVATTYVIAGIPSQITTEGIKFSPTGDYIAVSSAPSSGTSKITLLDHTTPGSLSLSATYGSSGSNTIGNCAGVAFSPEITP